MFHGRNNGKKLMAVRIVKHAFEIIHLLTDQNPIQILVGTFKKILLFSLLFEIFRIITASSPVFVPLLIFSLEFVFFSRSFPNSRSHSISPQTPLSSLAHERTRQGSALPVL